MTTTVDIELALLVDFTIADHTSVITNHVNLFTSSTFFTDYVSPLPNQKIAVSFWEFADGVQLGVGWSLIANQTDATNFGNAIAAYSAVLGTSFTDLGTAIIDATASINSNTYDGTHKIIDIASNGYELDFNGNDALVEAGNALTAGIDAINAIATTQVPGTQLPNIAALSGNTNPGSVQGFVKDGLTFSPNTYRAALEDKFAKEFNITLPPDDFITYSKIGFTTHDRAIVIDGVIYQPWTSADPTAIAKQLGLKVDDLELRSVLTVDSFDQTFLLNNGLRNARITTMPGIDWRDIPATIADVPDNEKEVGLVGQVRVLGKTEFAIENLSEASSRLAQPQVQKTSPLCNVRKFCDERCGLDIADYTFTATVTSVASQIVFNLSDTHDFSWGSIRFTSGENAGAEFPIASGTGGLINMLEMAEGKVQIGDEAIVKRGCSRTMANCIAYGNIANFRGIPTGSNWMPGADFYKSSPTRNR